MIIMDVYEAFGWIVTLYIAYITLDYIYHMPRVSQTDKAVFITGCDTGFGFDAARRFDRHGMCVFAACLTERGEENLKNASSQRLKTFRLDVTKLHNIEQVFEMVKKEIPDNKGLWGLINNAGIIGKYGPEDWLSQKDYEEVLDVNLHGLINTTMTFLPLLKQSKGRIINVSSIAGRFAGNMLTPYSISKYGVECFSDAMRRRLKPFGTSVHIIEPGFHTTPLMDTIFHNIDRAWQECPQEIKKEYGEDYPVRVKEKISITKKSPATTKTTTGVIDALDHALLAKFPRPRYIVGLDARFLCLPVIQLPEFIGDWVLKKKVQ